MGDHRYPTFNKESRWHTRCEYAREKFGMKTHIGVDADLGLAHTIVTVVASVSNVTQAHALLHVGQAQAFNDAAYPGVTKRERN